MSGRTEDAQCQKFGKGALQARGGMGPSRFLDLPVELQLIIYRMFFGMLTLLDAASARWQNQASMPALPLTRSNSGDGLIDLLLVCKKIYKEAAPQLYQVARAVVEPEKIIAMMVDAHRPALPCLAPEDRVGPENNIRCLTISLKCDASEANNHDSGAHARAVCKLRAAIARLRTGFPQLEELVVQFSHHQDLISGSAVVRFVSPLCCLHRLKSIRFVAEDVRARAQAKAAGEEIKGATRLKMGTAVLLIVTDIFTKNCGADPERESLHEDVKCIYRDWIAGVRLQQRVLAPILRKKHRLKVAALA